MAFLAALDMAKPPILFDDWYWQEVQAIVTLMHCNGCKAEHHSQAKIQHQQVIKPYAGLVHGLNQPKDQVTHVSRLLWTGERRGRGGVRQKRVLTLGPET